jgi:hypothetical protein
MSDRDIFAQREHWLEEVYFRKKDEELVEKLHRLRERQSEHHKIAEIIGVAADDDVIDALQYLGYTDKTIGLLYLIPLVQIAWSEGGAADREIEAILKVAEMRGIEPGSSAHQQLIRWLSDKPREHFFEDNLHALRVIFELLPPDQRTIRRRELIDSCNQIASIVEGGIMGRARISEAERTLIAHIATAIGQ